MSDATALFGARAGDYARHRPSYPAALFDDLAAGSLGLADDRAIGPLGLVDDRAARLRGLAPPADVAEVGSGTGLFAEALLGRGYRVLAVEPNGPMREAAERRLGGQPGFVSVDGRAEATTLPDASVDLVVAAQALHWFTHAEAAAELRRIARPPHHALFVWNVGDRDASPFMREYHALACDFAPNTAFNEAPSSFDALVASYAPGAVRRLYPYEQPLDREGLVGRLRSAASAPKPGEPRDVEMCARLGALFDAHEQNGTITIAYLTVAHVGHLAP